MFVRKATKEECNTIVEFQLAMAKETEGIDLDRPTVEKGVKAVFSDSTKGNYYIAEEDGRIAGSLLTTFEWSDWRNGTILWIQSVYVHPDFRRQGVYRSLYAHLKEQVQNDKKLNGIRLYADKSNITAHKTYIKMGMNHDHYVTFEWLK